MSPEKPSIKNLKSSQHDLRVICKYSNKLNCDLIEASKTDISETEGNNQSYEILMRKQNTLKDMERNK